ncbi:MAG TPA: alkaline phosphatase family protein [Bradyrhizobium sp.]|nr:alkaline phosphatase family protein [Bradyrhizobium sp.]
MANQLGSIKHIVQLMLENRSFDQMLGFLYEGNKSPATGQPFEGLTGNESNPDDTGRDCRVFRITRSSPHPYLMPGADPGEGFQHTNYQLFSTDDPLPNAVPTNKGFVIDFKAAIASDLARGFKDTLVNTDPSEIMGMYSPEMLPIMSALAKGFAVCDHWFSSAPTQTLPNRAFAAAATSLGFLANAHAKFFTTQSIYGLMSKHNVDWGIYGYNAEPMTRMDFPDTRAADDSHYGHFRDFQERAAAGTLPAYSFLEPDWGASGNSQHPNYDVSLGEKLIHDVYYTLRNGPAWNDTLLVITYDEHGGNYDHVAPPWGAVAPDNSNGEFGFQFDRFGVRVPALLISPRIARGTVFRAQRGTIDHTSVLKTIERRWNLPPLTARDKAAPDLGDVLTLASPRTDDPLAGVEIPVSGDVHPDVSEPSLIQQIHAEKVATLPLRNQQGSYDEHVMPDLPTSSAVGDYIQTRTAAWRQHLQRHQARRAKQARAQQPSRPAPTAKGRRGRKR